MYSRNQKQRVYNRDSISLAFSLSKYRAEDDDLEPSEVILAKFPVFDPDGVKFGFSAWEQQNIAKKTFLRRTVPEKYLDLFAQFFLRVFLFLKKAPPTNQPPCRINNGGCSHLCLVSPYGTYKCACPNGARELGPDGRNCNGNSKSPFVECMYSFKDRFPYVQTTLKMNLFSLCFLQYNLINVCTCY